MNYILHGQVCVSIRVGRRADAMPIDWLQAFCVCVCVCMIVWLLTIVNIEDTWLIVRSEHLSCIVTAWDKDSNPEKKNVQFNSWIWMEVNQSIDSRTLVECVNTIPIGLPSSKSISKAFPIDALLLVRRMFELFVLVPWIFFCVGAFNHEVE